MGGDVGSFVDIVGDDRLQAILDDPRNFNLRALRAETILDWIPDLGTYTSPSRCRMQNGLHRTPGLAASGVPAVLRHRFWEPEDRAQIVGRKYIGLLIYDSDSDDYTFELSTGSDLIGALRPWRHDNRRHLLVYPEPVDILGGHIPFQVRALGTGLCYLESVVFLSTLPEPTTFAPTIHRLQAQLGERTQGTVAATIHFTTQEPATALVEAFPLQQAIAAPVVRGTTEAVERLHRVTLSGLREGVSYRIVVTATERSGATATAELALETSLPPLAPPLPLAVPVEILRTGDGPVAGMPLTFGVPVAQGWMREPTTCFLRCGEKAIPAQARVHARWPDGSARWVLVDAACPDAMDGIAPGQTPVQAEVRFDEPGDAPVPGLVWQAAEGRIQVTGERLRVTVTTDGPLPAQIERRTEQGWQPVLDAHIPCLEAELGNGVRLANGAPEDLVLEEAGRERAVIRYELPLVDAQGIVHFRTTIRIHVYAGLSFVRLLARTVVTSPVLAPAFGGKNLDHLTPALAHLRDAVAGSEGELASLLLARRLELHLPWRAIQETTPWQILHEHDRGYWVDGVYQPERHPGLFVVPGTAGALALDVKHFWQTCPKGAYFDGEQLKLAVLPELSGEPLPDYDELWYKLYSWLDPVRSLYRLKSGQALTTEMVIGWSEQAQEATAWHTWLAQPTVVRPALDYLNNTQTLLPFAAKQKSPLPRYDATLDQTLANWLRWVDERHEYGFANFGDTYSDQEWFWSNNEYDATLCQYVEFLRGGDPGWPLLGGSTARHLIDMDTCNYSSHSEQIGAQYTHIPGHAGGFLPPYFRCKIAGSSFKPSHSWVEGAVLHYLLTGDETMRHMLKQAATQYTRNLANYDYFNARECGWHLTHLCGLARLDGDPSLLNAASIIVDAVLEKQEPGGGWEHPLAEAHCHCEPPRCHGEAGFMVGVLLSGLRRYHLLTGDPRVADAIVGGARWLVHKTFERERGVFRYTSCPNRKNASMHGVQLIEGLATAQAIAPDPVVAEGLAAVLAAIEQELHTEPAHYGRDVSMEARYILMTMPLLGRVLTGAAVTYG
jgi:hypothetical protein